jgi:Leucine-rich repeat (LRR) protein
MSQRQEFKYKPLNLDVLHTTNKYIPQINIEDKIYFNDFFLDHELRKLLDIDEDIIITKSHLDSIKGVLSLRDKRIEHILGLENMTNITGIDLSINNIEYIPFVTKTTMGFINKTLGIFDKIKDLQYINLASNRLINIDYIYKNNLTRLDLSNNGITSIKIIGRLYDLEYLNIANNFITDIYPLTKLKKLNFLNISYNYINKSPKVKHYYEIIKTKNKHLGKFLYKPQKKLT